RFRPKSFPFLPPLQPDHSGYGGDLQLCQVDDPRLGDPVSTDDQLAVLPYLIRAKIMAVLAGFTQCFPGGFVGNDMSQALAGGLSPYMASVIHDMTTSTVQTSSGPKDEVNVTANLMAHALLGAITAQANGNGALAGASGAVVGEYIAQQLYPGVNRSDLSEEQKQIISTLSTLSAGLAGGISGDSSANAIAGAQAGKNAVENNALSDIAQAQFEGKTLEQKAGEYVEAENERYKKENCSGLSAEACSVKMYTERRDSLKDVLLTGTDFVPVVGTLKTFTEAESALDYLFAAATIIPGERIASGLLKTAQKALKKGDVAEASRLMNEASDEISKVIIVNKTKYPESARHIEDAQKAGHPTVLTIDRSGAAQRRKESLRNTSPTKGADRDEYPPAMFKEGGKGASVRPINPSDNRGAGACIGAQCRGLPDGTSVIIKTDKGVQ
ncbi:VENN motif pre-toxin domain-containing protein, partial [Rahnella sp. Larv3_ips]|uniref:VENN motif pre-toxin domain-containing protein n=1 Tax=Rahnella sp. Larv3_ips TaxID=1896943 RepID=UPI00197FB8F9